MLNTLYHHNFELQKVEQEIKDLGLYGSTSRCALGRQMNKMKSMLRAWNEQSTNANSTIEEIREKLENKIMSLQG